MSRMRRPRNIFIHSLFFLTLLAVAPCLVLAEDGSVEIPKNARAKSFGSGWECNRGYREVNGACAAVKVPANAFPTNASYGHGWQCSRGYRQADESCAAIKIPPNAYLDASGDRWRCDRGYQSVDEACVAVKVPPNGYLTDSSYGPGWECDRGYQSVDAACVAVKVPENAHLNYSGNDWDCNQPYRKQQGRCTLPEEIG